MINKTSSHSAKDSHYARLRRQYRNLKVGLDKKTRRTSNSRQEIPTITSGVVRLYGLHTVRAALSNPQRHIMRMLVTKNTLLRLELAESYHSLPFSIEIVEPKIIEREIGFEAVHQGVMIETKPLTPCTLSELKGSSLVLILDQITDPHNVGAIMRSAVAFGASAIITTARHTPQEAGVLAKTASGALEVIPHIEVCNLANALNDLHTLGFTTIGLDSQGSVELEKTLIGDRIAIILGAEGKGLRRKTREITMILARLDMPGVIKSLNVSNAAAISLYIVTRYLARIG